MKLKPHRPRSCLGWFAWVFGILLLIFVSGNIYAQWRMAQVTQDLASLAKELGYTPDAHLHHEITVRDVSIITGSAYCEATLIYATPMEVTEFKERLGQILPETRGAGWKQTSYYSLYIIPNLTINGVDIQETDMLPISEQEPVTEYGWYFSNSNVTSIQLYGTKGIRSELKYKDRRVLDNVVRLHGSGGIFPIWIACPATFSDEPDSLFD
jgi:hypothetical protein